MWFWSDLKDGCSKLAGGKKVPGGPGTKSQTLPLLMYQQAFKFSQIGLGTAIALILLCVGGVFSIFYIRMLRPEV